MNRVKDRRDWLKWWLAGRLGKVVVDLIFSTMRIQVLGFEQVRRLIASRRFIFAFWHSRILMVSYLYKGWGGAILVSKSKDGEATTQILQRQGHHTIRGSTSRHGVPAMTKLIKALREQVRPGVVVPDGPRGPRFKVQPGIITLAQKTGYPIVPISYSARRLKVFGSWDRFVLPYPFGQGCVIYGEPISVPSELDAGSRELYRMKLEDQLNRITKAADQCYGHKIE
ncbi:MAG: lysophospholipid acyltransferase family protein [Deltaproteobacteria bacterium]